jgi:hypothetical protein
MAAGLAGALIRVGTVKHLSGTMPQAQHVHVVTLHFEQQPVGAAAAAENELPHNSAKKRLIRCQRASFGQRL